MLSLLIIGLLLAYIVGNEEIDNPSIFSLGLFVVVICFFVKVIEVVVSASAILIHCIF